MSPKESGSSKDPGGSNVPVKPQYFGESQKQILRLLFEVALSEKSFSAPDSVFSFDDSFQTLAVKATSAELLRDYLWRYLAHPKDRHKKKIDSETERSNHGYPTDKGFCGEWSRLLANIHHFENSGIVEIRNQGVDCSFRLISGTWQKLPEVIINNIVQERRTKRFTLTGNSEAEDSEENRNLATVPDPLDNSPDLSEQPPSLPPFPYNLPISGVSEFVGRSKDMSELHQRLESLTSHTYLAITGMGGIGKTELAIQYSMQYCDSYDGGIAWVRVRGGEDPVIQLLSFAVVKGYQLNPNLPPASQLAMVWNSWVAHKTLIIFDDVDDLSDIRSAIPPRSDRFIVLITTRYHFGPPVDRMEIDVLNEEASLALLGSLVGEQRVKQEIDDFKQLYKFVDGLPLGLELIGRFLRNRTDLSVRETVAKLELKRKRWRESDNNVITDSVFQFNLRDLSTAQKGALACFDLTWEQLSDNAKDLGKFLCSYDESLIVWKRVYEVLVALVADENSQDFDSIPNTRTELILFSLLKVHQEGEYYYHPLLKDFFRSKMTKEEIEAWGQEIY